MKSKKTTYLLIVVVLAVWGVVLKKIFFSNPKPPALAQVEREAAPAKAEKRDSLLLNYRDPFLGTIRRDRAPQPTVSGGGGIRQPLPPKPVQPPRENIAFRYLGTISSAGRRHCLMETGGKHYSLKEGDELNGFTLKAIFPDSVHFAKAENLYTVKLSN